MGSGNSQNIQLHCTAYPTVSRDAALVPPTNRQLLVHSFIAVNNSSAAGDLGFGIRLSPDAWNLWGVRSGTPNLTAIQGGTPESLFTTTNNEGVIVQSRFKFNSLSFILSQSQAGSPAYAFEYWNGTAWVTLPTLATPSFTGTEAYVAFLSPIDWTPGSGSLVPVFDPINTGYTIRIRATTAGSQAVLATSLNLARLVVLRRSVGVKQHLQVRFSEKPWILQAQEALIPYFGNPDPSNSVEIAYQVLL